MEHTERKEDRPARILAVLACLVAIMALGFGLFALMESTAQRYLIAEHERRAHKIEILYNRMVVEQTLFQLFMEQVSGKSTDAIREEIRQHVPWYIGDEFDFFAHVKRPPQIRISFQRQLGWAALSGCEFPQLNLLATLRGP